MFLFSYKTCTQTLNLTYLYLKLDRYYEVTEIFVCQLYQPRTIMASKSGRETVDERDHASTCCFLLRLLCCQMILKFIVLTGVLAVMDHSLQCVIVSLEL